MLRRLKRLIHPVIKIVHRKDEQIRWTKLDRDKLEEFLASPTGAKLLFVLEDRIIQSTLTAREVDEKFREGMVSVYGQLRSLAESGDAPAPQYPLSVHPRQEGNDQEDRAYSENPMHSGVLNV